MCPGIKGAEVGIFPLSITPSNPLGKVLVPVHETLSSTGLEIWGSEKEHSCQKTKQAFH